jgi:hypothetical protein
MKAMPIRQARMIHRECRLAISFALALKTIPIGPDRPSPPTTIDASTIDASTIDASTIDTSSIVAAVSHNCTTGPDTACAIWATGAHEGTSLGGAECEESSKEGSYENEAPHYLSPILRAAAKDSFLIVPPRSVTLTR